MEFSKSSRSFGYFAVTVLCVVCYWNSLECELVHDDIFAIVENEDLRPGTPISEIFKNDFWGKPMKDNTSHKSYRPLCVLTFRLNYMLHGLHPLGYHLVNVALHLAVSLFFVYFCEVNIFHDEKTSMIAGMLFAVHPVHTEAVTGVVGRADVLACLFFLLSFHLYERARRKDEEIETQNNNFKEKLKKDSARGFILTSIICGCVSMLCKENGITAFGMCIALEVIHRKNYLLSYYFPRFKRNSYQNLGGFFQRISIIFVAAGILLMFRLLMLHGQLPAFNEEDNPASFAPNFTTRFMTYLYLCAFNVWLLLSPVTLSYDWQIGSIPLVESLFDVRNLYSLMLVIGLLFLLRRSILSVENESVTIIGLCLLIIPFIPASNLFFRVGFVVAERILYIPSTGYCILVAHGIHIISQQDTEHIVINKNGLEQTKDTKRRTRSFQNIMDAVFIALIALMVIRTISRNKVWKNRESLFKSGIETLPQNAKVHYNYANYLKDTKKLDQAIQHYKMAVKLYPKHASSHNNLATLLGDSEEAEFHFKQTLVYQPFHYKAMYNLASIYRKRGRKEIAKSYLESCLSVNSKYSEAIQVYAETLHDLGEREKGLQIFHDASLTSKDADFFNNYGVFLGRIGKDEASLKAYKRSLELNPVHRTALVNIGRQQKAMGKLTDAEISYRKALKIERDSSTLQFLGILLFQTKRLKEAELAFSEALKYDRKNPENIRNHASAVFEQGQRSEAIDLLIDGLKVAPESVIIVNTLANFLMSVNRKEEAMQVIESGLKAHPEEAELHFIKANMFREKGNLDQALQSYKNTAKMDSKHFGAHQNIGVIYHLQGFKIEAKHYYDKALALDPTNEVLKENIKKLIRSK